MLKFYTVYSVSDMHKKQKIYIFQKILNADISILLCHTVYCVCHMVWHTIPIWHNVQIKNEKKKRDAEGFCVTVTTCNNHPLFYLFIYIY